jgi:hypothetical protein
MNKLIYLLLASSCVLACKVDKSDHQDVDGGTAPNEEPPLPDQVSPINTPVDAGTNDADANVEPTHQEY